MAKIVCCENEICNNIPEKAAILDYWALVRESEYPDYMTKENCNG